MTVASTDVRAVFWWRWFRRFGELGMLAKVSAGVIAVASVTAVIGGWVAPHRPTESDLARAWGGPTGSHLLGSDFTGGDMLSRLLAGARSAMLGPLVVVVLAVACGVSIAIATAWLGGRFDSTVGAALDVVFAFPAILLAILAATVFGVGVNAAVIALSIAYTPYIARVVRGAALQERAKAYIAALEVQGMSARSICARHLVPNVMPIVVAQATTLFGYAMVDLAAISFIGLGVQRPHPDWGLMVNENLGGIIQGHPWPSAVSGLCLVVVVVAFNLLGDTF